MNIFTMMFVYHHVIIPFHPQNLPRHAPLILQSGGSRGGGSGGSKPLNFLYCECKEVFCYEFFLYEALDSDDKKLKNVIQMRHCLY